MFMFESKIQTSGKLIPMTVTLYDESLLKEALAKENIASQQILQVFSYQIIHISMSL